MNETTRNFFRDLGVVGEGGSSLFFRSLSLDQFPHPQAATARRGYVRLLDDHVTSSTPPHSPSPSSSDRYYSLTSSASSAASSTKSSRDWSTAVATRGRIQDGVRVGVEDVEAHGDDCVRMCRLTADEVVATELAYVADLRTVIEGYLEPIRAKACDLGLVEDTGILEDLFGNIEQLYTFHQSFCRKVEENRENLAGMAHCFSENKSDLRRHYEYYCQNYPKALAILYANGACRNEGNTRLQALRLFIGARQSELQHKLPLSSYLLKPVQRILKYPLMLKNLERHVTGAGLSRDVLSAVGQALVDISGVASRINEARKAAEMDEKLRTLVRGILDWPGRGRDPRGVLKDFLRFGDLILEAELECWVTPTPGPAHIPLTLRGGDRKRAKTRHVFLFQSAILIFKRVGTSTYAFKDMLSCREVRLSDTESDGGAGAGCCFALLKSTPRGGYVGQHVFKCSNPSQKSLWTSTIRDLTNVYRHTTPPPQARYDSRAHFYLETRIEPPSPGLESKDKRYSLDVSNLATKRQGVNGASDLASKALSGFQRLATIRRSLTANIKMASHFYDDSAPPPSAVEGIKMPRPIDPQRSKPEPPTFINPYLLPSHAINFQDPSPGPPARWSQTSSASSTYSYSSSSSGVHSGTSCTNVSGYHDTEK